MDFLISDEQLRAIAISMANCDDLLSQLVRTLQQLRALPLDDLRVALRGDRRSDQIIQRVHALDYEVCFAIHLTLQEKGSSLESVGQFWLSPELSQTEP